MRTTSPRMSAAPWSRRSGASAATPNSRPGYTGITFNACRDWRRRRGSFRAFSDKLAVLAGIGAAQDGRDLYDAIWLKSAIARLKPALRDTAVLVAGQQLTHAEAAQILGVAEATVSWRMHEVRRILSATGD